MSNLKRRDSFHDTTAETIDQETIDMSKYFDKVVLIVNVASRWGLTAVQYAGLNELYDKYKSQGLEILGFPCNQFLSQEPGTDDEIQACARTTHKAKFPVFKKIDVNGSNVANVFQFIKSELPGFLGTTSVKWNFTKFLIDRDGRGFKRYSPNVDPMSLCEDVETLLAQDCTVGEVKKSSVVVGGGAAATDVAQLIVATKQLLL